MSKVFVYQGGPKDQTSEVHEDDHFPEAHDSGEYRWSGWSRGLGASTPEGPFPEASKATVVWHPKG